MKLDKLIGNTPMIKIIYKYNNKPQHIYAKLEYYNYTGSIKDRIVYKILSNAMKDRKLKESQPIIEVTSGNTGISLAAIGAYYNYPVHIFMPDWVSLERQKIIKMFGANVYTVSRKDGGFSLAFREARKLSDSINGFELMQFENDDNIATHYNNTANEILQKLGNIESFVSGIGTGGTLMGCAKKLKEFNKNIKIYAFEPDSLPLISKGLSTGSHKIEGVGDDFIPSIVDTNIIDDVILINDDDAINMSRLLSIKLRIGCWYI